MAVEANKWQLSQTHGSSNQNFYLIHSKITFKSLINKTRLQYRAQVG